ncbi:protein TolR [Sphingomonadales bacterium 56]|jgi:biopolymer transport protein TolR|uniref:Protein TolR n=1 Tax=Sphingobium agri TaxID=2933566 RepID=A0ABT0DYX8_9SPHN|nr:MULTISPECIES: protein TolR [Sphingobium]MBY2928999.1 protein TolR [Sphingomonadales bacterium 56]MBY2959149.1 protein TolR [Sphingomonadales bacterium 58]MCK0532278.1 protein TolR [Sphingobium agri]CAD7338341.1 Biopolymer transport protein ExbD [Sphingobium sp. S6]CAD7338628.1 Biopolymer transport protein ExbD [Sphingobium sp. S8]
MAMSGPPSHRRGRGRAPMADINVTPLVDVMLVLLIIFMVTAPLLVTGVPVNLPETRAKGLDQDDKPAVVSIDRDGGLYIDETQISDAELPDRLAEIVSANAGKAEPPQIFLRADTGLDYGRVMRVMGELNRAGLNKVALVSTGGDEAAASGGSE